MMKLVTPALLEVLKVGRLLREQTCEVTGPTLWILLVQNLVVDRSNRAFRKWLI